MIYILSSEELQTKKCEKFCKQNNLKFKTLSYDQIHLIVKETKKEKISAILIKDFENINLGIINYAKTITSFLVDNNVHWDALFLIKDFHFWHNQINLNLPKYSNCWTGFGEYISKFLIKKISSPFDLSENPINFQAGVCILNYNTIEKTINEFNFNNSNMLIDLHSSLQRLGLYLSNPYLNLFSNQFEAVEDTRRYLKFIYPKKEFDPFSYENLGFNYNFVLKIGSFFFEEVDHNDIVKNLKFYFNNKYYDNKYYLNKEIDYEKSCLYYSLRFGLPEEIKKIEKSMKNKQTINNNTIKIIFTHPFDKNKSFTENISFNLIKKIDFYTKYR